MGSGFKKLAARLLAATCLAVPLAMTAPMASAPGVATTATAAIPTPIPTRVLAIYKNAADICGPITGGAANPVIERRIQDFNDVINQSQTGRDLMNVAAQYDSQPAWMCFANKSGLHALYYINKGVIGVGMSKTNHEIVADTAHELSHLFEEKAGAYRIKLESHEDLIHAEYASEAEAEAKAALVLWELKQAGQPGPWEMHNNPLNYGPRSICYAHISTAFQHAIDRGATPPEATREAFRTWYKDRGLLSHYRNSALGEINAAKMVSHKLPGAVGIDGRENHISSCQGNRPDNAPRGFDIPSDGVARQLNDVIGQLPSYQINYIQQGGGLKAILQGS